MTDVLSTEEKVRCTRYEWLECPDNPADQCSICQKIKTPVSEERLRNTRAWAAARTATLSGADVIVRAIDELLARRAADDVPEGYTRWSDGRVIKNLPCGHSNRSECGPECAADVGGST